MLSLELSANSAKLFVFSQRSKPPMGIPISVSGSQQALEGKILVDAAEISNPERIYNPMRTQ